MKVIRYKPNPPKVPTWVQEPRYGITKMAEKRGRLGYECKIPATRNVTCLDDYTPSGMAVIDLCEPHYQEYLLSEYSFCS